MFSAKPFSRIFVSLPILLFGGAPTAPNWHEAVLESAVALAVWLPGFLVTRKLLRRLHHAERFIRVRAACRRIGDGDEWMPMEEYFAKGFNQQTAHAICLDCAHARLDASLRDAWTQARKPGFCELSATRSTLSQRPGT